MITFAIILLLFAAIFFVASFIVKDEEIVHNLQLLCLALFATGMIIIVSEGSYKDGCVQTLKGQPPYKMEIRYELRDSVYVPVDTTYVKIKT